MTKWRPHRGWYFSIPVLALVLVAGSIYWFVAGDDSPTPTADVPARSPYRDIGAGVAVPRDVSENLRATVDETATTPPFQQVEQLGAVVHITPDGPVDRPLTLRFKLNRKVKPEDVVFAVSQTGKVQDWQLVAPAKVDGEYAYVTTSHLSWWDPLWRSFTDLVDNTLAELKRQFEGLAGDAFAEAERPTCDNEQRARDNGYSIAWQGAEVLYWCLGLDGDRPVVRIVNKRRYPIFVNHAGITVPNPPKSKLGVAWLAQKSFSDSRTVMLPFDSLQLNYDLGNGQRRSFTTEYNGFAGSLNQLEFGVTTLINILTRFGAGGGTISNGAITITQFDRVAEVMSKALLFKDCANALNTDTPNSGAILSGCFSPSAIADMFGWQGVLLAAVMVVGPVVSFFRGQFDTLGDLLQGKDHETVTVGYTPPAPPKALFAGTWTVHGAQMVINKNGTGTYTWNAGPCTQSLDETRMCQGNAALTFTTTGDSMVGTYARVWYTTGELPAPPDFDDTDSGPKAGETFTIRRNDPHTLITADATDNGPGNPYLCDSFAMQHNDSAYQLCGA